MKRSTLMTRSAILAVLGAGLALAGCNQAPTAQQAPPPQAALPLTTANTPPIVDAPLATQLPPAPRARIARVANSRDNYAYADQAYSQSYGLGDAPPDYTFDYNGSRPWVWRADDNSERVVEPLAGGDRYYYYRPGQEYPYLVRDPDYTYGYDNGALVVIYDRNGRLLPPDDLDRRADYAGRYLARGRDLYYASQQRQREAVAAANWSARRTIIAADLAMWAIQQNRSDDWRAYHDEHQAQQQAYWDQERYRRQAQAARADEMLNDHPAAQAAWQGAQQAQADARAHGQNFGGGQRGGSPSIFGQRNNPPAANPQAPAQTNAQNQLPMTPGAQPARPQFGQGHEHQGPQEQGAADVQRQAEAQRQAGQQQAQAAAQARAQVQAQAATQSRQQADAQARQQAQASARAQADAAHKAQADQARLQADAQVRQQAQAGARAQADAARRAQADQARLQADAQMRQQAQAGARAQADAAHRAQADQARLQADAQVRQQAQAGARAQADAAHRAQADQARLQADAQMRQQAQAGARAQAEAAHKAQADQTRLQADAQARQQAQAGAKVQADAAHKASVAQAQNAKVQADAATAHGQQAAAEKAKAEAARKQREHDTRTPN